MTRNHWVWYLDVCGGLSFKNDMYVFSGVVCVAGAHFRSKLVHELLRVGTRFWGIVDSGAPKSV